MVMGDPNHSPVHELTLLGFQIATINVLLTGIVEKGQCIIWTRELANEMNNNNIKIYIYIYICIILHATFLLHAQSDLPSIIKISHASTQARIG